MLGRRSIKEVPRDHHESRKSCSDEKRLPPAKSECYPRNQRRCNDSSDTGAAVENRHSERALANRKPLCYRFRSARPVTGFAEAENEPERAKLIYAARRRVQHRCNSPDADEQHESAPGSDPVENATRHRLR